MRPSGANTTRLLAWPAFLILGVLALLSTFTTIAGIFHFTGHWTFFLFDFDIYRAAGRAVLDGVDFYDPAFGRPLFGKELGFAYTPAAAALFAPFAAMPTWLAYASAIVCFWLLPGVLFTSLIYRRTISTGRSPRARALLLAVFTASVLFTAPGLDVFGFGQVGLLFAAMILFDMVAPASWMARVPRGVGTGVAAAIKLTPLIVIGYWLVTGQWRKFRNALLTVAALWSAAWIAFPGPSSFFFLHGGIRAISTQLGDYIARPDNQSFQAAVMRWTHVIDLGTMGIAITAIIGTLGVAGAWRAHRAGRELHAAVILGIASLLASPVSWIHHYVWLLAIPAFLLAGSPVSVDGRLTRRGVAWWLAMLPLVFPGPQYGISPWQLSGFVDGYMVFAVVSVIWLIRDAAVPPAADGQPHD